MVIEEVEKLVTKHGEMKDAEDVNAPENVLNVIFILSGLQPKALVVTSLIFTVCPGLFNR